MSQPEATELNEVGAEAPATRGRAGTRTNAVSKHFSLEKIGLIFTLIFVGAVGISYPIVDSLKGNRPGISLALSLTFALLFVTFVALMALVYHTDESSISGIIQKRHDGGAFLLNILLAVVSVGLSLVTGFVSDKDSTKGENSVVILNMLSPLFMFGVVLFPLGGAMQSDDVVLDSYLGTKAAHIDVDGGEQTVYGVCFHKHTKKLHFASVGLGVVLNFISSVLFFNEDSVNVGGWYLIIPTAAAVCLAIFVLMGEGTEWKQSRTFFEGIGLYLILIDQLVKVIIVGKYLTDKLDTCDLLYYGYLNYTCSGQYTPGCY